MKSDFKLLKYGTVFARFSPDLKQQLIEALIEYGHYVGMCGDGANDCGALKAAHAGISLSEAEASVASPFTSKQANIECVLNLIREGRAALVTSFGIFKFMACYSLTQFMSVCILYWVSANITDLSFLYIDLILLSTLGFTFSRTQASSSIVPRPPRVSLLALSPLLSIIIQLIINFSFQLSVWFFTIHQPWFEPYVAPPASIRNFTSHEVTAVFSISAFQYIILAIVFSKGAPYRKKIFTNSLFMLNIFLCFIITSLIVLYPIAAPWFLEAFQLKPAPVVSFRWLLMLLAFFNFLVSFFLEMTIIDWFLDKKDFGMRSNLKDMDTFNKSDVPENIMFNVSNNSSGFYNADVPHSVAVHKETDRRSVSLGHNIETQGDIEFQNIYEHRGSLTNFDDTNEINKLNVNNCNIIMDKNEQSVNSINLGYANLNDWLPEKNEHKNLSELMRAEMILWERLEAIHKAHEAERCHIKLISSDEEDNSDDENVSKDANGMDQERKRDSNLPSRIRKLSDEIFRRLSSHHDDIQLIED